ncbi:HNH endonuclease signature motif containing protein [Paractinoplanes durhamensis]|uniref:HNH endonuclease signature motif containing protein n=1 Tax=Paractinoplanes durhamensis TaxID=113563 RepID=UPI001EF211C9|nr:HNH endonuclease signature motif containing protein [Actinoplanes durhamensis]
MVEELEQVRGVLAECGEAPLWSCSDPEVVDGLTQAWACVQQALAIMAHLIREAETRGIPQKEAASSTPVWLRQRLRTSMWEGKRLAKLAAAFDHSPALDAAVTKGEISAEQACVIAESITDLPADAGIDTRTQAESLLINYAADFAPGTLGKLGARILAHVDPEAADRHDEEALRKQDERAHRGRGFTLSPRGDGRVRLSGWLDTTAAAIVNAALDPLCHPGRDATVEAGLARTPEQRRADALVDVCTRVMRGGELPASGGEAAQVVVTIPIDTLRTEPGEASPVAVLDTGAPVSAAEARLLACDAQIIPSVLGTEGQVLDVGRARRLFTASIRRALVLRDRGCTFPSCDRPANWSDGHHVKPWADGGPTALSNACLLCRHHHRVIHRTDWQVRIASDGHPEFIPPADVDPQRRPLRNTFHRRE